MIIYADILFAVNFIMDYMSLYVCSKVLDIRVKKRKLVLASLFGAGYAVFCLYINLPEPVCAIFISVLMCYFAFGRRKFIVFLKTIVLFYTTGMLFGGIMTFINNVAYKYRNIPLFENGIDSRTFFALSGIVFAVVLGSARLFRTYMYKKSICVEVCFNDKTKKLNLMCDTGNLLRDPFTDLPVIILKAQCLDSILGKQGIHRQPEKAEDCEVLKYKLRYIPVKTAAGNAVMPALKADNTYIFGKKGKKSEIQAVLACDLVCGCSYAGYDGLIPYTLGFDV